MTMKPRLLRSGLTGAVYVVTSYSVKGDLITAHKKYDVTEDFNRLVAEQQEDDSLQRG